MIIISTQNFSQSNRFSEIKVTTASENFPLLLKVKGTARAKIWLFMMFMPI